MTNISVDDILNLLLYCVRLRALSRQSYCLSFDDASSLFTIGSPFIHSFQLIDIIMSVCTLFNASEQLEMKEIKEDVSKK